MIWGVVRSGASWARIGIIAMVILPEFALAGGFSNPDFGGRRMGMFSVVARPDDVTAVFHNPAGLTLNDGTQFYHAQSWFIMNLRMKMYDSEGTLQPLDHDIKPDWSVGAIPFIGMASDLGTKDFRVGFGIYAPNAYGASMPDDEASRYHATQALFLASRATFSVAYKFSEVLRVGASISLIHVYLTAARMMNNNMPYGDAGVPTHKGWDERFKDPSETWRDDLYLTLHGQDWTWAMDIGILVHVLPNLRLGAAFSGGSAINLEGSAKLYRFKNLEETGKFSGYKYDDAHLEEVGSTTHSTVMTIPFSIRAGLNWEPVKNWEIGLDFLWWHYQVLQEQESIFSEKIMGLSGFQDPKNYDDSWAWSIGTLYRVLPELELMCGFQMDFTPIPQTTYTIDNPSTNQHGISLGLRWTITDRWRVSLGYVHNWFQFINVQESVSQPPTNASGHGRNNEVAFDFSYRF